VLLHFVKLFEGGGSEGCAIWGCFERAVKPLGRFERQTLYEERSAAAAAAGVSEGLHEIMGVY